MSRKREKEIEDDYSFLQKLFTACRRFATWHASRINDNRERVGIKRNGIKVGLKVWTRICLHTKLPPTYTCPPPSLSVPPLINYSIQFLPVFEFGQFSVPPSLQKMINLG